MTNVYEDTIEIILGHMICQIVSLLRELSSENSQEKQQNNKSPSTEPLDNVVVMD